MVFYNPTARWEPLSFRSSLPKLPSPFASHMATNRGVVSSVSCTFAPNFYAPSFCLSLWTSIEPISFTTEGAALGRFWPVALENRVAPWTYEIITIDDYGQPVCPGQRPVLPMGLLDLRVQVSTRQQVKRTKSAQQ